MVFSLDVASTGGLFSVLGCAELLMRVRLLTVNPGDLFAELVA